MIVEQIWTGNAYRNFNYLVACPESGEALAIDPLDHRKCLAVARDRRDALRLERTMLRKGFEEPIFKRLPNLDVLSRMNWTAAAIGFVLVTAAIGWGASWYGDEFGRVNILEPKIFLTLVIWTALLAPLIGRPINRWPDRATAVLSVFVMAIAAISIVVPLLVTAGFHGHS